jgi:2-amino-4-hydroxy-6-hydroxymethyldihydropteridine diphosphokinase
VATVYLVLGANLGDREANLRAALRGLEGTGTVKAVSSLYETEPVGGPEGQPPFLNAACLWETELPPEEALRFLKELERELGRRPGGRRYGPREIDLDILLYDDRVVEEEGLTVPHARLAERAFAMLPLAEIAPDAVHPVEGKTIAELAAAVGGEGVRTVAERGWERRGEG